MRTAKFISLVTVSLLTLKVHGNYANTTDPIRDDPFYLSAEWIEEDPVGAQDQADELDDYGWDGRVEQIGFGDANLATESLRVNAVAAVEKSKCKPQVGMASWYGGRFQGGATSSGEAFNTDALTAANRVLPMGTRVRVTNKKNGLSVVVRINDRGPYVHGRVIDVSQAAAKALRIIETGPNGKVISDKGIGSVQVECI